MLVVGQHAYEGQTEEDREHRPEAQGEAPLENNPRDGALLAKRCGEVALQCDLVVEGRHDLEADDLRLTLTRHLPALSERTM